MNNIWQSKTNKPITILAPMAEVTDYVFREVIATIGKPDILYTEFVSVDALVSKGKEAALTKLKYSAKQKPIVAQLWGNNPQYFKEVAALIQDLGFDGIDLNTGCPAKDVMKTGCGAALINNYTVVENIINSIKEGAPALPLCVKTRLAKDPEQTREWFNFLLKQNIEALTLHARTAKNMSKVPAKWTEIGELIKLRNSLNSHISIIGNGDVMSLEEINEKYQQYTVEGVMVGRGIFQNPWLFNNRNNQPTNIENLQLLWFHTNLFTKVWGTDKNFEIMKRFFKIYVKNFKGASELRNNLMQTKAYEQFREVLFTFVKTEYSNIDPNLQQPINLENLFFVSEE